MDRNMTHTTITSQKDNIARGGHRIATVLMYLTDVGKGGETVFPKAEESPHHRSSKSDDDLSKCAKKGIAGETVVEHSCLDALSHFPRFVMLLDNLPSPIWENYYTVKPQRGNALLFFSLHPNAIPDSKSLHAGCPVIEGEKWSATKWIHVDSFDKIVGAGGDCANQNDNCERWAALGECTNNPEYMVGTAELPGYCRRSCKSC